MKYIGILVDNYCEICSLERKLKIDIQVFSFFVLNFQCNYLYLYVYYSNSN